MSLLSLSHLASPTEFRSSLRNVYVKRVFLHLENGLEMSGLPGKSDRPQPMIMPMGMGIIGLKFRGHGLGMGIFRIFFIKYSYALTTFYEHNRIHDRKKKD